MSKIGKKPIALAKGVEVKWQAPLVRVKGPKGELTLTLRPEVDLEVSGDELKVKRLQESKIADALHGTYRSLIKNMIQGVTEGFERRLELVGVGYKAEVKGKALVVAAGFSHPVEYPVPPGIEVAVEKSKIIIKGIDKHKVGKVSSEIRAIRPPEPYQGKGIRYEKEVVRKKAGKAAAGAGAPGVTTK
jgi:large subunit ribosomal protein L6